MKAQPKDQGKDAAKEQPKDQDGTPARAAKSEPKAGVSAEATRARGKRTTLADIATPTKPTQQAEPGQK